MELIEKTPGAAALIMRNVDGTIKTHVSKHFQEFEIHPPDKAAESVESRTSKDPKAKEPE